PHTRFVADFIGETNFITGTLKEKNGNQGQIELSDGLCVGAILDNPDMTIGQKVTIAIRPEKISLIPTAGTVKRGDHYEVSAEEMLAAMQAESNTVVIPAVLWNSVYIGTDMRYIVELGSTKQEITVRIQNFGSRFDQRYESGQSVYAYWVTENARVLLD
ncbi:MAG: TOBE domain-containing protein, partial [Anaerolineae bacterium]|nr:TOBE domain-containing protein [Anaerolineae bacterium]